MGREGFGTQVPDWRIAVRIREVSELAKEFKKISAGRRVAVSLATTMGRLDGSARGWRRRLDAVVAMTTMTMLHPLPSSPGLTGGSSTPRVLDSIAGVSEYWMPACADDDERGHSRDSL
jgi:hypothetical protein